MSLLILNSLFNFSLKTPVIIQTKGGLIPGKKQQPTYAQIDPIGFKFTRIKANMQLFYKKNKTTENCLIFFAFSMHSSLIWNKFNP